MKSLSNKLNRVVSESGLFNVFDLMSLDNGAHGKFLNLFLQPFLVAGVFLFIVAKTVSKFARLLEAVIVRTIVALEIFCLICFVVFVPKRAGGGRRLNKRIAHISLSQLDLDIRIEKYVRELTAAGIETYVIGADLNSTSYKSYVRHGAHYAVIPCAVRSFSSFWRYEQCKAALQVKAAVYHANDLTSLLPALVAAKILGARVIYDAHEVWSQNVDYSPVKRTYVRYSTLKRWCLSLFEMILSRQSDLFVTVNAPIASFYQRRFLLLKRPMIIRNVPRKETVPIVSSRELKRELGLSEETFLLGYIGGVGPSRNIESVLKSLKYLRDLRIKFFVMGPNLRFFESEYRAIAREAGAEDMLILKEGVPMDEVPSYMCAIDGGILMLKNLCLNFYLFLPNKLFEYMSANVPVLASNFPVVSPIVLDNKLGFTFDPESPEEISKAIRQLVNTSKLERAEMGARGRKLIFDSLHWELEVVPYLECVFKFFAELEFGPPEIADLKKKFARAWSHSIPIKSASAEASHRVDSILPVLACSGCSSSNLKRNVGALVCQQCGAHFPFNDRDIDMFPHDEVFGERRDIWKSWYEAQIQSFAYYKSRPEWNVSHGGRPDSKAFQAFIATPNGASILDIGCGTFETGYSNANNEWFGLDPYFSGDAISGIKRVRGIAERLPFKNQIFDAVVFATSLDHVIDPTLALSEASRVLKKDGVLYVWDTFKDEACYYTNPRYLRKFWRRPSKLARYFTYGAKSWRVAPVLTYWFLSRVFHYKRYSIQVPVRIDEAHLYRYDSSSFEKLVNSLGFEKFKETRSPVVAGGAYTSLFSAYKKT